MATTQYLSGPFAPVTEELTAFDLPVTGRIPADLSGRYLRNGPNPLGVEDPATHIWTFGAGMVHGVRIRDGRAEWYRNRWVRSSTVSDHLGEPARPPIPNLLDFAPNVHVIGHAGRTFALVEDMLRPYELDDELGTVGPCDLGLTSDGFSANAHAKRDPRTGDLHAVAFHTGRDYVKHIVVDAAGTTVSATDIPVPDGPYMHDFALTERYVIVYDLPLTFSLAAVQSGRIPPYVWNPGHQARVGLLPRAGGPVRWLEVEPCFVGHTLNAYDDGDSVVVDVIRYGPGFDPRDIGGNRPALDRWTIDLAEGKVREERIDDQPQDFPRINETNLSRAHRYGYAAANALHETFANTLIKHDFARGTREVHRFPRDAAVGEAVFVPSSSGTAEDDGYLMAYAHNPERDAADLVILSAQDISATPVARIHLPGRVPLGFHGSWIPDR
nr:carotenoid oxygenase family protein [Kibdelosporangium sp. MJ126-NF4]CEL19841.1 dioxygenase (secreted protein) [Kibdelosporangium sp. MJ126-NF4]CTQ97065.1 dioxygenase (secreted protein) [Kibdelosporangium sp. MJ126-NF4]